MPTFRRKVLTQQEYIPPASMAAEVLPMLSPGVPPEIASGHNASTKAVKALPSRQLDVKFLTS